MNAQINFISSTIATYAFLKHDIQPGSARTKCQSCFHALAHDCVHVRIFAAWASDESGILFQEMEEEKERL